MELTIKSRKLDREVTFSRPGDYYIHVDINGLEGTLGEQICKGGRTFSGATIGYVGDDQAEFEKICRGWLKAYIRNESLIG